MSRDKLDARFTVTLYVFEWTLWPLVEVYPGLIRLNLGPLEVRWRRAL